MLKSAKVVQVYPDLMACDIIFDGGQPLGRVPILSSAISSDGGFWGTPSAFKPTSERNADGLNVSERNICAVVGIMGTTSVVMGFYRPVGAVMSFKESDRAIYRHPASGGYATFAPDGSAELFHASGAYLRIGTGAHQDLASVTNGNWEAPALPHPTITIGHPAFTLSIDPAGNMAMTYTSLTMNGPIQLNGSLNATGDGIFEGVSVPRHDHNVVDVSTGSATIVTQPPVPGS